MMKKTMILSEKLSLIDDWNGDNEDVLTQKLWNLCPHHKREWALYYTHIFLREEDKMEFINFHLEKSEKYKSEMNDEAYKKQKQILKQLRMERPCNARHVYNLMYQIDKFILEMWGF